MMKTLRRTALAMALTAVAAAAVRLRGTSSVPPQGGGWRELTPTELR